METPKKILDLGYTMEQLFAASGNRSTLETDNDGQLVIYTNLIEILDGSPVELPDGIYDIDEIESFRGDGAE